MHIIINNGTLTEFSCESFGFDVEAYDSGRVSAGDGMNGCDVYDDESSHCNR